MFCDRGDLLIAISSSGKSKNILNSVTEAQKIGCGTVTLSGFQPGNPLSRMGDLNFYVPSSSYGVVEIAHLLLIHTMIDEVIRTQKEK
jgi:D-sedoheptulose 7-phosphate isomerase